MFVFTNRVFSVPIDKNVLTRNIPLKKSIACLSAHVLWGAVLFQDWFLDSSFTIHPVSHSLLMLFSLIRTGGVGRGQEDSFCSGPVYSPDGCQIGRRLYLRYLRSGCHQKSSVWRKSWHHHLRNWQRPGVWVYGFVMKSVGEILNDTNIPKVIWCAWGHMKQMSRALGETEFKFLYVYGCVQ